MLFWIHNQDHLAYFVKCVYTAEPLQGILDIQAQLYCPSAAVFGRNKRLDLASARPITWDLLVCLSQLLRLPHYSYSRDFVGPVKCPRKATLFGQLWAAVRVRPVQVCYTVPNAWHNFFYYVFSRLYRSWCLAFLDLMLTSAGQMFVNFCCVTLKHNIKI